MNAGHHGRRCRDQRTGHEPVSQMVLLFGRGDPAFLPRAATNPNGFNSRRPGASSLASTTPREALCFLRLSVDANPVGRGVVVAL